MVRSELNEYEKAATKTFKSAIIGRVLTHIQDNSGVGGFVKPIRRDSSESHKKKRATSASLAWVAVDPVIARANVAQAFRDALSSKYRSSRRAKQVKRFKEQIGTPETTTPTKKGGKDTPQSADAQVQQVQKKPSFVAARRPVSVSPTPSPPSSPPRVPSAVVVIPTPSPSSLELSSVPVAGLLQGHALSELMAPVDESIFEDDDEPQLSMMGSRRMVSIGGNSKADGSAASASVTTGLWNSLKLNPRSSSAADATTASQLLNSSSGQQQSEFTGDILSKFLSCPIEDDGFWSPTNLNLALSNPEPSCVEEDPFMPQDCAIDWSPFPSIPQHSLFH